MWLCVDRPHFDSRRILQNTNVPRTPHRHRPRRTRLRHRHASAQLPALRVFVVVVFPGTKNAQAHADLLLTLRFPQFVVLLDPPGHSRARDWKARSDGKRGFWERVETLGIAAVPS